MKVAKDKTKNPSLSYVANLDFIWKYLLQDGTR